MEEEEEGVCPLCGRPYGRNTNLHHLIPKSKKGTEVVRLHVICHTKIHSVLSERELEQYYNTIDRLLEHEEIRKFVKWVRKQPPDYHDKNIATNRRKGHRRRKR